MTGRGRWKGDIFIGDQIAGELSPWEVINNEPKETMRVDGRAFCAICCCRGLSNRVTGKVAMPKRVNSNC